MPNNASLLAAACMVALLGPSTGCLVPTQASVVVVAPGETTDVTRKIRQTLATEGHAIDATDDDAGIVYTEWQTWGAQGEGSLVYRYVVVHEGQTLHVSTQLQNCPQHSTIFDNCEPYRFKKVPKSIQTRQTALGDRLKEVLAG